MKKTRMRSYRLNEIILQQLKEITQKLDITETRFVEMAIIEKIGRIQTKN